MTYQETWRNHKSSESTVKLQRCRILNLQVKTTQANAYNPDRNTVLHKPHIFAPSTISQMKWNGLQYYIY